MAATVEKVKCACGSCQCMVGTDKAIEKDGKFYCSEACATGHADGSTGCGHPGCTCG